MKYTTVIIPAFKHEEFLKRCLDSLIEQTVDNFDVVLIDDGSNPPLENVFIKYKNKLNIKYFFIENTGFPSEPRNYGVKNIKTPYISFLDSDDFFHPKMIEKLYENIVKFNHRFDLIHTYSYEFSEKYSSIKYLNSNRFRKYSFFQMIKSGNKIVLSSVTIRSKTFLDIGGFIKVRWEDYNLFLSLIKEGYDFYCINLPLVYHSISDRYSNKKKRMNSGFLYTSKRIRKTEHLPLPLWAISYLINNSRIFKYRFILVFFSILNSLLKYKYGVKSHLKALLIILFSIYSIIVRFIKNMISKIRI